MKLRKKAPPGFEPGISCLLDRRFNQLSHGAGGGGRGVTYTFIQIVKFAFSVFIEPTLCLVQSWKASHAYDN